MRTYRLTIDCVDGETSYSLQTPEAVHVLTFLKRYDHEGSSVSLIWPDGKTLCDDKAYEALEALIQPK